MYTNITEENKDKVGLYIIHNKKTDQTYVGSGILGKRYKTHEYLLRNGRHWNKKLQVAYNRDPDFDFIALEVGEQSSENREIAYDLEQVTIDESWGNPLLLNLAKDVERPMAGFKHGAETKEALSRKGKQLWQDPTHREKTVTAQNRGRRNMTPEQKAEASKNLSAAIQRGYDDGSRKSLKGQTRSDEFKAQNSSNIKKLWQDPEYRRRQIEGRANGKPIVAPNCKTVMGDGVEYQSINAAGRALGISMQSIAYRIKSQNYPGWYFK